MPFYNRVAATTDIKFMERSESPTPSACASRNTSNADVESEKLSSQSRKRYTVIIEDITDDEEEDRGTPGNYTEGEQDDGEWARMSEYSEDEVMSDDSMGSNNPLPTCWDAFDPDIDVDETSRKTIEELIADLEELLGPQSEEMLWQFRKRILQQI